MVGKYRTLRFLFNWRMGMGFYNQSAETQTYTIFKHLYRRMVKRQTICIRYSMAIGKQSTCTRRFKLGRKIINTRAQSILYETTYIIITMVKKHYNKNVDEITDDSPTISKFIHVNNIMRVTTIIYNATIDHTPMWQGKLLNTLYYNVSKDDVVNAINFLSNDGIITKQYGDDGCGNQVVLLTFNPEYIDDYMHLLLDIAPKYEEDDEPLTFEFADKIVSKIVGISEKIVRFTASIKAKLSARKNSQ